MLGLKNGAEVRERALRAAESYQELARVFSAYVEQRESTEPEEQVQVGREVSVSVCAECPKYSMCWEERKEECRYAFDAMAEEIGKNGILEPECLPEYVLDHCILSKRLVEDWNRIASVKRLKKTAFRQMMEGKEALVHQLQETAQCFFRLSEEENRCGTFSKEKEKEWRSRLKPYHLRVGEVIVRERPGKGREWEMALRSDGRRGVTVRLVEQLLGEWLGIPVKEVLYHSRVITEEEQRLVFQEEPTYCVRTGAACTIKKEQNISGDSFSFFYEEEGEISMILSDGMGSGEMAAKESEEILDLLERMLSAGFREETAIHLINSVLALRAEQQSFATLDISRVNLYSGVCKFIKIGGAATYIKRGNWLECVSARTLPIGMVQHTDYDSVVKKLYDGDVIIMVSDGVLEAVPETERERFLLNALGEDTEQKPQVMAGRILNASLMVQNYEPKDDMTVLVCGIYRQKSE